MLAYGYFLFGCLLTLVVLPATFYRLFCALVRPDREELPVVFFASVGLAPIFGAWLIWILFEIVPGLSAVSYVTIVALILSPVVWYAWARLPRPSAPFSIQRWKDFINQPFELQYGWFLVLSLSASYLLLLFIVPSFANDPLEYRLVAAEIFRARDMSIYPLSKPIASGLYVNASHPPGFHMQLVWTMFYEIPGTSLAMRLVVGFYGIAMAGMVWALSAPFGKSAQVYAVLLLVSAHFLGNLVVAQHIDPQRIYFFLATFVGAGLLIQKVTIGRAGFFVFCAGASAFSHSIGVLALPFAGFAYFIFSKQKFPIRIVVAVAMGGAAMLIGGWQYISNVVEYGAPLQDYESVLEMPSLQYSEVTKIERKIEFLGERFVNGALQGFTKVALFGFVFWFGAVGLALYIRRIVSDWGEFRPMLGALATGVLLFTLMLLVAAAIDFSLVIKNPRYVMTIVPVLAPFGGAALALSVARILSGKTSHEVA